MTPSWFHPRLAWLLLAFMAMLSGCASLESPSTERRSAVDAAAAHGPPPSTGGESAPNAPGQGLQGSGIGPVKPLSLNPIERPPVVSLRPPEDLWERIRRGFAMPDLDNELVTDRIQWYSARPDYILRMTERSQRYLFHIVEELERRNMPTEIALLPFIESAFNPQAVSSAKAAGMWQFMPQTGKSFDLRQNAFRDDRRDVLESTRAALDYLQRLYNMFGDWQLALAAYNWGEGSVSRALARNKAAGLGLSYSDLNMPQETRFYVPKLQAVKNLIANPEAYGIRLPRIENHPYFQSVPISRDIDVALAAKLAEISLEDFRALNPSMTKPVILAAGTPQVLLPWDNAAVFERNLASYQGRLASWTAWVAPSTMSVAEAARRTGTPESELRRVNGIPPKMLIKAGSTLLVTRSEAKDADVPEAVADHGQVALAPEVTLRRAVIHARRGDSVESLAKRYGVAAATLAHWNNVGVKTQFRPGQAVTLLLPTRATPNRSQAAAPARKAPAKATNIRPAPSTPKATSTQSRNRARASKA
jgi:membrane-bound lytic murein transglycosylase D